MKKNYFCFFLLLLQLTAIQAQESAFEVFLPYKMDFLNPFGWETSDGCFIVNPGNNMFVKLSPDGKVVGETAYTIESSENVFTRIVWCWAMIRITPPIHPITRSAMTSI